MNVFHLAHAFFLSLGSRKFQECVRTRGWLVHPFLNKNIDFTYEYGNADKLDKDDFMDLFAKRGDQD